MKRNPFAATDKQIKFLELLTNGDFINTGISKRDAQFKISNLLKSKKFNENKNKIPTLVEYFDAVKINFLVGLLSKISIRLNAADYNNESIDLEFGVVQIEIVSDTKIKHIMDIDDCRDYVEIVLDRKMKSKFRAKYSIGVLFQQNKEYLTYFYKIIQHYYKLYYPDIKFTINIQ